MTWLWVTAAIVIDGAAALVGGLMPDRWLQRHRPLMMGFAAGALLAAALLDMVPEAIESRGVLVLPWLLGTMVALAGFEWVLGGHDPHEHGKNPTPYALLVSDGFHNFGDGIAIAAAFLTSTHLGIITSLAVIVHEVPEELADYAVLRAARFTKRTSLIWLAVVQMTAAAGAAVTLLGASLGHGGGVFLAIAAGTFVYIALMELMPDVLRNGPRRDRWLALGGLVAGVAAIWLLA
jgi:zinc and cadmium transporter